MAVYKCKMCGGSLEVSEDMTVCECEYCGTKQTLPKTDDEQKLNLFNRANHFRQQCEFDKAAEIYEKMISNSENDAELYWSLVLCRYGIEYVDDPLTKKKIPTCHRTQYKSILEDPDFLTTLENADNMQRRIYESEAAYINKVQKGILEISNKEDPFDVFICYKETDEHGRRTPDSVLAQELYYCLIQEGFKVFFSRITLESKLGTEYEPYIFSALNSAKVMVVVGTKPEYFNAVWVHNEWSRYLMIMQNDRKRTIIPAYKDMDPYDLPDALSMFQAQDMSKLGFMQDLIRGIKKLVVSVPQESVAKETAVKKTASSNVENLLKRGNLALEDCKWKEANNYFEQVLNENVEEYRAYVGKLCAELQVTSEGALSTVHQNFPNLGNYKKACRFGGKEVEKRLYGLFQQGLYDYALSKMDNASDIEDLRLALKQFTYLGDYKDSKQKAAKCKYDMDLTESYNTALKLLGSNLVSDLKEAIGIFNELSKWEDTTQLIEQAQSKIKNIKKIQKNNQITYTGILIVIFIMFCCMFFPIIPIAGYILFVVFAILLGYEKSINANFNINDYLGKTGKVFLKLSIMAGLFNLGLWIFRLF